LLDGHAEDVNREFETGLLISKGERAASLPRPESVVLDFDLDDLGHARGDLKDLLGFAHTDSAGLFPAVLVTTEILPLAGATLHLLLQFIRVLLGPLGTMSDLCLQHFRVLFGPVTPLSHLACKCLHHLVDGRATATATVTSTATTTTATTTSSATFATEVLHQLVDELHRVIGRVLALLLVGFFWSLFVEHSDHDIGGTTILPNLEESMVVTEALFTLSAVVKVLAHRALVAQALDW